MHHFLKKKKKKKVFLIAGSQNDVLTFKKVGCEPSFVDGSVRYKLQPELVGAAFDVVWFVIATEMAEQRAVV